VNKTDFALQIIKLQNTYGEKHYPKERNDIIWEEVRSFSSDEFEKIVNTLIGEHKFAPMLEDFRKLLTKLREKHRWIDKRREEQDIKNLYCDLADDEIKHRFKIMIDRIAGKVPDKDWAEFLQVLKESE